MEYAEIIFKVPKGIGPVGRIIPKEGEKIYIENNPTLVDGIKTFKANDRNPQDGLYHHYCTDDGTFGYETRRVKGGRMIGEYYAYHANGNLSKYEKYDEKYFLNGFGVDYYDNGQVAQVTLYIRHHNEDGSFTNIRRPLIQYNREREITREDY